MFKKFKTFLASVGNLFTEVLMDAIFLSLALYILFPHIQWIWNHLERPKLTNFWGVFMSDWSVAWEAYLIGFAIIIAWFYVKWQRSRRDSREHKILTKAIEKQTEALNNNNAVLERVVQLLEKMENRKDEPDKR